MGILSCDDLDDTPPPSAYVPPAPEPEPEPGEPCKFEIIVPELADGIDFECGAPEITSFEENEGSLEIEFVENPDSSGINTSEKVVQYTQTAGVQPWAGFFFKLASKVDFSVLRTIKIKVYSPASDQIVLMKLEDAADGSIAKEVQAITTVADQWEELTFTFSPSDTGKFDNMVLFFDFSGKKDATTIHYFDDIVMAEGGAIEEPGDTSEPTTAAPVPTVDPSGVISIFSDAFTDVADTDFNPNWGQGTQVTQEPVGGNNTLKYANLNYQGTAFASAIDVSVMTMIHVDYWTADSSSLNLSLISPGTPPKETPYAFTLVTGQWVSVDIPLSEFSSVVDLSDVFQLKFDGNGTIYLDNIYFHAPPATEPTAAATVPAHAVADVISLFSDAYTNVAVDTWITSWSEATLEDMTIADNAVKKYSGLNFVGVETVANQIDATEMTHFHTDIWTADATQIRIKLVDFGADGTFGGGDDVEHEITMDNPEQHKWISLDIPLADFGGLTSRANIAQLIYAGKPVGSTTLFVDNVYFHK
jgi:hypothetical protein